MDDIIQRLNAILEDQTLPKRFKQKLTRRVLSQVSQMEYEIERYRRELKGRHRGPLSPEVLEQRRLRKLSDQVIDAGYRAMALKLHPDQGGSTEDFLRLAQVKQQMKRP